MLGGTLGAGRLGNDTTFSFATGKRTWLLAASGLTRLLECRETVGIEKVASYLSLLIANLCPCAATLPPYYS